jgi:hypothetical protein
VVKFFASFIAYTPDGGDAYGNGFYEMESLPRDTDGLNTLTKHIMLQASLKGVNLEAVCVLFFTPV